MRVLRLAMRPPLRRRRHAVIALAAGGCVLAALITGCGGTSASGASGVNGNTLSIGFITDLSGVYQDLGYPAYNGAQIAIREINDSGGIKVGGKSYKIKFATCQANSDNSQAAACARSLVRDQGLKFILGGTGPEGPGVADITDPAGAIYMAPGTALSAKIKDWKHVFVPLPTLSIKINLTVAAIKKAFPDVKTVAFVTTQTNNEILPELIAKLKASGIRTVSQQTFDKTAVDVTPQLSRAKAAHPDLLFVGWTFAEAAPALKGFQTVKAAPNVYVWTGGGDCSAYKQEIGSAKLISNDLIGADLAHPDSPAAKQFVAEYKKFVTTNPDAAKNPVNLENLDSAVYYPDGIQVLVHAMEEAGTVTDTTKIVSAMGAIKVNGIQGPFRFGPTHESVSGIVHCTYNVDGPGQRGSMFLPPSQ